MRALAASVFGDYSTVLTCKDDVALPTLRPLDVLIRVAYSDVNPVDLQKLSGGPRKGQEIAGAPFVTGFSGSGWIEELGTEVPLDVTPGLSAGKRVAFLADPTRSGTYAEYCAVDYRCVAPVADSLSLQEAACVPLAGLTAYESLVKLKVGPTMPNTRSPQRRTLLVIGGAGGVGSWATLLARAWYTPEALEIISTTSEGSLSDSGKWCQQQGATRVIRHDEIDKVLQGGRDGSVDAILCLTEPTPALFSSMSEVIRPYGFICLVVAGSSIQSLDMGFCFFKGVSLVTETVFGSIRTNFEHVVPRQELQDILKLVETEKIPAVPLSPLQPSEAPMDWAGAAIEPNGVLAIMATGHVRGKLVLPIAPETTKKASELA